MHIVEFCASNRHHGTDAILEELEKKPDIETIEYGCMGNCKQCMMKPFVKVNGEYVAADNPQALRERIEEALHKKEAEFSALEKLLEKL